VRCQIFLLLFGGRLEFGIKTQLAAIEVFVLLGDVFVGVFKKRSGRTRVWLRNVTHIRRGCGLR
jgi:hypothetical protein